MLLKKTDLFFSARRVEVEEASTPEAAKAQQRTRGPLPAEVGWLLLGCRLACFKRALARVLISCAITFLCKYRKSEYLVNIRVAHALHHRFLNIREKDL